MKALKKINGQVKVGCEFFMDCEGDTSLISIETGVNGLYIDLNPEEALEYIPKREEILQERLNKCNNNIDYVQQHIQVMRSTMNIMEEANIKEPIPK